MLNRKKMALYFHSAIKMTAANPIRMALTAIGIFVSVFLFAIVFFLSQSYYRSTLRIAEGRVNNSIILESAFPYSDVRYRITDLTGVELTQVLEMNGKRNLLAAPLSEDRYFNINAEIFGMNTDPSFLPILDDQGRFIPIKTELISGRLISQRDVDTEAKVAVIDRYTADLLFPEANPIGQHITLNVGENGSSAGIIGGGSLAVSLEVIGVIEPPALLQDRFQSLKKQLRFRQGSISLETYVWCPITTFNAFATYEPDSIHWVGCFTNEDSYRSFTALCSSMQSYYEMRGEPFRVETREDFIDQIENEQSYIRRIIRVGMVVLCVITGISIMSITVFSVKERIPEIGIRKAFGATGMDVAFQISAEILLLALITSIIAVCLAFYTCKSIELILTRKMFMPFVISVSATQLLLPVCIGCLEAFLCSILPAMYAARIQVTSALRFE